MSPAAVPYDEESIAHNFWGEVPHYHLGLEGWEDWIEAETARINSLHSRDSRAAFRPKPAPKAATARARN